MKYIVLFLVMVSLALCAGYAYKTNASHVRAEIQPLLDEMLVAANAHDTDRFMAPYLHDQNLVFVFNGMTTVGWDVVHALQFKWWKGGKTEDAYVQNGRAIFSVLGPYVAVVTNPLARVRKLPDGQFSQDEFVITMVWEKRPEGWRIIQAHESTLQR